MASRKPLAEGAARERGGMRGKAKVNASDDDGANGVCCDKEVHLACVV